MDYLGGANVRLPITFMRGSEPLVPDVGSVTYSVYDHTGAVINDQEDIEVITTSTTFRTTITVPAVANAITAPRRFERRLVVVQFEVGGAAEIRNFPYRIIPSLNHSVTPQQVRGFVGVNTHELADEDIDIIAAYITVENRVTQAVLDAALITGTIVELAANELIRMAAVLNTLPGLKQRLAQEEKNGVKSFARPIIKDFAQLAADAQARYDEALGVMVGADGETNLTLVIVTQDIDPITGA